MRPKSGLVLLVIVGVLGVLMVLAAAFVTMARLERRSSQQRLNGTKALLLARSGLEDGLARLSAGQEASYGGEDWNRSGALDGPEAAAEVWRVGSLDVETCPVRDALRPSFFAKDPATLGADGLPAPRRQEVDRRARGYTGTLAPDGNAYALKIEDESAKINVNGGFLDVEDRDGDGIPDHRDPDVARTSIDPALPPEAAGVGRGWNAQLARTLDVLGQQADVGLPGLGAAVLQQRPAEGYRSVAQLQARIGTAKDLSPWLTVSSWMDRKVVHPNGYAAQTPFWGMTLSDVKKGRVPLELEEEGRPPVNLNAAPKSVLVALLQGLEGHSWQNQYYGNLCVYQIPAPLAASLATALLARRPFATWEQFSETCDALVPGVINGMNPYSLGGGNLCGADLLKANFNPNTQLLKELPDQLLFRWIDKSDLTVWSTEGSLGPTGTFRIGAIGRVLGKEGILLAERGASLTVEAFSLLRQTTQQDFVAGRLPDASASSYLSLANPAPPFPILPQRTTGASASWNPQGGGQGLAAVTYPCAPTALPDKAADYDGAVALATVELGHGNPKDGTLTFLQHFDDGWDADLGAACARQGGPGTPPSDSCLQTDAGESTWPVSSVEPGTLYPDGAHAQNFRAPAYQASGNFPLSIAAGDPAPSNHGVIGYWVKPMATAAYFMRRIDLSCVRRGAGVDTQTLAIGRQGEGWGLITESLDGAFDNSFERQFHVNYGILNSGVPIQIYLPGLRWHLVTALFDTDQLVKGEDVRLAVRGARGIGASDPVSNYPIPYATASGRDLFQNGVTFTLNGQAVEETDLTESNQVIDEFAICDFGDVAATAVVATQAWAANRYADGRYYKGGDARFLSTRLEPLPGAPVRLLRADWTAYTPADPRLEVRLDWTALPPPAGPVGWPRLVDPLLVGRTGVELELLDAAGTLTGSALQPLGLGARIQRTLSAFRYRARFRTTLADPANTPMLETPVLDDVTFAWQPATGPRVLGFDLP